MQTVKLYEEQLEITSGLTVVFSCSFLRDQSTLASLAKYTR